MALPIPVPERPADWPEDRAWPPRGAHPAIPESAYVEPGKPSDPEPSAEPEVKRERDAGAGV